MKRPTLLYSRPITLCEVVAKVAAFRPAQLATAVHGNSLTAVVARWRLGFNCTPDQWEELTQLCLSQGRTVPRYER